ncbi:MAG: RNA 3'-terminal phosphate cyclase [Methanotrichaceae archaeon]|nr:RNA 3'-terminal phosphate cyclase [Methanotrichaceae archaeon]
MIEIDGSHGEGGGQIVRTSVALSAVCGEPVRVFKIRKGRPRPGLAAQHVKAIEAMAMISGAQTVGVAVGSMEVVFRPGKVMGGSVRIDIGTAGSVTLLIECLLPALTRGEGPVSLQVNGGTDVRWSPTIDYLERVALPAISSFGVVASLRRVQRGYYPRGGGIVYLDVVPGALRPADLAIVPAPVRGISHSSNLPPHVAKRQALAAEEALARSGYQGEIDIEVLQAPSTGSGITLWSGLKGGSSLGERGLPAERVGSNAAGNLIEELGSSAAVDVFLADQLIPYLALAGGSFSARAITKHTLTNIWTAGRFLDREIRIFEGDGIFLVEG